jgi:hypothetical protein
MATLGSTLLRRVFILLHIGLMVRQYEPFSAPRIRRRENVHLAD